MMQMPVKPKQFCSESTSNRLFEDKWDTKSMMSLSALDQSTVSSSKKSRNNMVPVHIINSRHR